MEQKNKYIKRTDIFISSKDLKAEDEKGNVYFNTKDRFLSLTLDNNMRVTFNSSFKGQELAFPDFVISGSKGVIVRIKNKENYPYYDIKEKTKKEIDYIEIINILKSQYKGVETNELAKEFNAINSMGLEV